MPKQPVEQQTKPTTQTPPSTTKSGGSNVLAIAALITGILGTAIIALILGILALKKANKENGNGKGMAIAGIILGAIGIVIWTVVIISMIAVGTAIANSGVVVTS